MALIEMAQVKGEGVSIFCMYYFLDLNYYKTELNNMYAQNEVERVLPDKYSEMPLISDFQNFHTTWLRTTEKGL